MSTEPEPNCPAVTVGEGAPCRWLPLAPLSAPYGPVVDGKPIKVLEVCTGCRRYRVAGYSPVPRDPTGGTLAS